VHVPKIQMVPELAVKNMMPIARSLNGFDDLMPDEFLKDGAKVDRDYFWGIFYKLAPMLVTDLTEDIARQRAAGAKKPEKKKKIEFCQEVLNELLDVPINPGK
jgi:hypothetical protein